jgi:hypothetical protein
LAREEFQFLTPGCGPRRPRRRWSGRRRG